MVTVACCFGVLLSATFSEAGIRSPGKYSGVAVFDRWDGCTLYSGTCVMYVSEKTKEGLRKYAGRPVQIDAKEVRQPMNPCDGLIGKFDYLGTPPPKNQSWIKLTGLHLASSVKVNKDGKAKVVKIKGRKPVKKGAHR